MVCKICEYYRDKKYLKAIVICPRIKKEVLVMKKFCIEKCDRH